MADVDGYEVGYGKPPKRTQFKKGRSGNPKGRPKGSKNISTLIEKAMSKKVSATEGGVTRLITKREALAISFVNLALKGDPRAIESILKIETRRATAADAESNAPISGEEARQQLIDRFNRMDQQRDEDREALKAEPAMQGFLEEHQDFLFGPPEDRLREGLRKAVLDARERGIDLQRLAQLSDHPGIVWEILEEISEIENKPNSSFKVART